MELPICSGVLQCSSMYICTNCSVKYFKLETTTKNTTTIFLILKRYLFNSYKKKKQTSKQNNIKTKKQSKYEEVTKKTNIYRKI